MTAAEAARGAAREAGEGAAGLTREAPLPSANKNDRHLAPLDVEMMKMKIETTTMAMRMVTATVTASAPMR